MRIGLTIALIRKAKNLKQYQLAVKADLTKQYLSDVETDKKDPSVSTLRKICRALDIPIVVLYILAASKNDWKNDGSEYSFLGEYQCINDFILNKERVLEKLKSPQTKKSKQAST